jgi:tetratricopeptide (TPR) repeat protein
VEHISKASSFERVLEKSGIISVELGHNYISPDLLCYVAISEDPEASLFLGVDDKSIFLEKLRAWLQLQPVIGKRSEERIPLLESSYIVLYLAQQYAEVFEEPQVDTHHLLLSLLSCDFQCTELLKERAWVFQNYQGYLASTTNQQIQFPDHLYPQTAHILRERKVPLLQRLFNSKWKSILGTQYLYDALNLLAFKEQERSLQALANASKFAVHDESFFKSAIYIYHKTRNWKHCQNIAEKAIKRKMDIGYFTSCKSLCHLKLGNYQESITLAKQALEMAKSDHASILNNIGFALSGMGAFADAIRYFDKALELEPDHAYAMDNKGFCLYKLGETASALECIHASLLIDKGNSYAYRNLTLIAHDTRDKQQAMAMKAKAYLFCYREKYGNDLEDINLK